MLEISVNPSPPVILLFAAVSLVLTAGCTRDQMQVDSPVAEGASADHEGEALFRPRMPKVRQRSTEETEKIFQQALVQASISGVVIVTPEGNFLTPSLTSKAIAPSTSPVEQLSADLFGTSRDLHVVVISYTESDALEADKSHKKCIPFLGLLIGLGTIGHRIVVFEGHPSNFPVALKSADILLVDDGMRPFLQPDWKSTARKVMSPQGRILLHRRTDFSLAELDRVPDELLLEAYTDGLMTTIGRGLSPSVTLTMYGSIPKLTDLTNDPDQLAYNSSLRIDYGRLTPELVMGYLIGLSGYNLSGYNIFSGPPIDTIIHAKLTTKNGDLVDMAFRLRLEEGVGGIRNLKIELQANNSALISQHPIIGSWKFRPPGRNCSESYIFHSDRTCTYSSGEETGESTFEISDKPSTAGYYKLTDTITKSNGRPGCSGGTVPIGNKATVYIHFHPARSNEFVMCRNESLEACFGPFKRLENDPPKLIR